MVREQKHDIDPNHGDHRSCPPTGAAGRLGLVSQLVGASIGTVGGNEFASALAELLEMTAGFENTMFIAFPRSGPPTRLFSNLPADDEEKTVRPYLDGTYLLDIWYNMAVDGVADGAYRLSDCAPDNFRETEYYRNYYAATGLTDECGIFVRLSDVMCVVAMLGSRGRVRRLQQWPLDEVRALMPCVRELVRRHWGGLSSMAISPTENLQELCRRHGLVGREIEVTCQVLRGYSNKMIGRELGISPDTVKVYRKRINRKLGTSSTGEVFAIFFQQSL